MESVTRAGEAEELLKKVKDRVLALVQKMGIRGEVKEGDGYIEVVIAPRCSVRLRVVRRLVFARYVLEDGCEEGHGELATAVRALTDEIIKTIEEHEVEKQRQEVRRLISHAATLANKELARMGFQPSGKGEWRRADGVEASLSVSEDLTNLEFLVKRGVDACFILIDTVAGLMTAPMCGFVVTAEDLENVDIESEGAEDLRAVAEAVHRALSRTVGIHHAVKYCYN